MAGYKNALRDRMPEYMDIALRWCKAKNRYIDYIYERYIKKENPKRKLDTIKIMYGLKPAMSIGDLYMMFKETGKYRPLTINDIKHAPSDLFRITFAETFKGDSEINQDEDLRNYWNAVNSWVVWFKQNWIYIKSLYRNLNLLGESEENIKEDIRNKFLSRVSDTIQNKLLEHIIKHIKQHGY